MEGEYVYCLVTRFVRLIYVRMTHKEVEKAALTFVIAGSETSKFVTSFDGHSIS